MRTILLTLALLTLPAAGTWANRQADGDALYERFVRWGLDNRADSVMNGKEKALATFADAGQWEHYYFVANLAIQMRMLHENNAGSTLRECQQLYEFATDHHHEYGRASVLAQMGWFYGYIGDHEEAVRQLAQSVDTFRQLGAENCDVLGVLYIYAYMLELTGRYDEQQRVIDHGKQLIEKLDVAGSSPEACRLAADQLLNIEALMHVHQGRCHQARPLIERIERKLDDATELAPYEAWRAVAEYRLASGDHIAALEATNHMEQQLQQGPNAGLAWGLKLLRTEILRQLGRSDEAYDTLHAMMNRRNTASVSQLRRQLSEMDSQYQMDQMRIQEQKNHFWWAVAVALIIIAALAVFAYFRQCTARMLARKNDELAVALDHAKEADRMKTAFVQHVTHEIRTPLNIITGFAQVIGNPDYELSQEERSQILTEISHNTDEITNLVNELLELSDSESQSRLDRNDSIDPTELCRQVADEAQGQNVGHLQLSVTSSLPQGYTLTTNAAALHDILAQLMSNALKFTQQGGVRVELATADTKLTIAVADTGIGIKPEHQEKIFERFYKVDSFKQGIGLGLTVARRKAEMLGGTLNIDPAYTDGARFVLQLPETPRATA